jgi:hypothetical protein
VALRDKVQFMALRDKVEFMALRDLVRFVALRVLVRFMVQRDLVRFVTIATVRVHMSRRGLSYRAAGFSAGGISPQA